MNGNDIKDHPNAVVRREMEYLKLRIKILETQQDHTCKAMIALSDNIRQVHDLTMRMGKVIAMSTVSQSNTGDKNGT